MTRTASYRGPVGLRRLKVVAVPALRELLAADVSQALAEQAVGVGGVAGAPELVVAVVGACKERET